MGYTDSLLADGEVIARQGRQHWLALLLDSRAALAVWVLAAILFAASVLFRLSADVSNVVGIIVLILVVLGLILFAFRWLSWINQAYIITNRRILKVEGIVNKKSADSSLEKINDLLLEENLLGRMLGYGDLDIITASDTAIDRFRMLNDAKEFKKVMLDQKHRLESGEDIRMPGPPLMASQPSRDQEPAPAAFAPAAPSAPTAPAERPATPDPAWQTEPQGFSAGSATPSYTGASTEDAPGATWRPTDTDDAPLSGDAAAAESMSTGLPAEPEAEQVAEAVDDGGGDPHEVTQTLTRLADLRDRGAITSEEYEAKKAELLSRL